jgi:hypothetical protein
MFEKLDFDLVQVDLQGAFGAACDAIRADMKCFCQALSIERVDGKKIEIHRQAMAHSQGKGSASGKGESAIVENLL